MLFQTGQISLQLFKRLELLTFIANFAVLVNKPFIPMRSDMTIFRRFFCYLISLSAGLIVIGAGGVFLLLYFSLPQLDGQVMLRQLTAPVIIASDQYGIPAISAANHADAVRALGYVSARDRLFQMDLMRRKNAGRLAEIFGSKAVDSDTRVRIYGFNRQARAVLAKLPRQHRDYLDAYAEGVNRYLDQDHALPFEFTVLGYRPERWRPEDSLLVALGMFDTLTSGAEQEERMLSVMEKNLPEAVVAFLTPDTDRFTERLFGAAAARRPASPIPVAELETLLAEYVPSEAAKLAQAVQVQDVMPGSNAWAVSGLKTRDGRAILANDMHLGISVPNIWYRCEMSYQSVHVAGVTLPGMPLFPAGSNTHIAWGGTSLSGDFLDLVSLELNPENSDQYKVADNWRHFEEIIETIRVKDAESRQIKVRQTIWGPVAIHWTALDENAVTLGLIDMDQAETLEEAVSIVNHSGGPQLNVLLADERGQIAWTLMGKIPRRYGSDGSVSRSWADGTVGWQGYVDAGQLPRVINPPDGLLASANERRLGKDYPYVIGRQFANGYRAYRITQRLKQQQRIDEAAMFQLQLDTENELHDFYRQLALSVLPAKPSEQQADLRELRETVSAWNGRADSDSKGFALLVRFRRLLAEAVFTPFLEACLEADKSFEYSWTTIDTPLQAMLTAKVPQLLPDRLHYPNWDAFILAQLKHSAQQLKSTYPGIKLTELTWGRVNKAHFAHPFSSFSSLLGPFLDMPEDKLSGCGSCVRVAIPSFGASERLVVSPAHFGDGFLHMPGGQSAHPLSPHYRDQQPYWVQGLPLSLSAGKPEHRLILKPELD